MELGIEKKERRVMSRPFLTARKTGRTEITEGKRPPRRGDRITKGPIGTWEQRLQEAETIY